MRNFVRIALCFVVTLSFLAGPAQAATTSSDLVAQAMQSAGVTVVVKSAAGPLLPGVVVTVDGAGTHQTSTTDANGVATFTLQQGVYTITVNKGGFQSGSTDFSVVGQSATNVNVTMTPATLENLSVIAHVSTSSGQNGPVQFNISSTSQGMVTTQQIQDRTGLSLTNLVTEIPGVWASRSVNNPNTSFIIRGAQAETKTLIDGHPVGSSTSGTYYSLFDTSELFQGVDVTKGAGLDGAIAGYSGVGTVNMRTRDFTAKDSGFLELGKDSYGGNFFTGIADENWGKFSAIVGATQTRYLGPSFDQTVPVFGAGAQAVNARYDTYTVPNLTNDYIGWQGNFGNTYKLQGELTKLRYSFSDTTSLTAEMLAFQGGFNPQAGAYGDMDGMLTVPQCLLAGKAVNTLATCQAAPNAEYNAPSAFGLVGKTVPVYTFFPGSNVYWNQPTFSMEFKTSIFGNDTLLIRPYAASIRRLIDGSQEPQEPGYGGGWYAVTNPANCQIQYVAATANKQALGPCFTQANGNLPYVDNQGAAGTYFKTTSTPYGCSAATPCYTTPDTNATNQGLYGFATTYTTLETDDLFGYTINYIHPVGDNVYALSFDHYIDNARDLINDASPEPAGCSFTLGQTTAANDTLTGAPGGPSTVSFNGTTYNLTQPGCPLTFTRPSPQTVPYTVTSVGTAAATAEFALTPKLQFDWGNYLTLYRIYGQGQNPGLEAAVVAAGFPSSVWNSTPILLQGVSNIAAHYDPHFGLVFRPTRDWAIRATAGSSMAIPYGSQVSGLYTAALSQTTTTFTLPNPNLHPESVVAFDLGTDMRFQNSFVFSGDIYNNEIYNPWYNTKVQLPACPAGYNANSSELCYQSTILNAGNLHMQGIEATIAREPYVGFGMRFSTQFERAYFLDLPNSLLTGAPVPNPDGTQLNAAGNNPAVPYMKGYYELSYRWLKGASARIGVDFEGNNNGYGDPAFAVVDGGYRVPLGSGLSLQFTGENILNYNVGTGFATGIATQGRQPVYGQWKNGTYVNSSPTFPGDAIPEFQTFRLEVQKKF